MIGKHFIDNITDETRIITESREDITIAIVNVHTSDNKRYTEKACVFYKRLGERKEARFLL